jgi:hypothetical protein
MATTYAIAVQAIDMGVVAMFVASVYSNNTLISQTGSANWKVFASPTNLTPKVGWNTVFDYDDSDWNMTLDCTPQSVNWANDLASQVSPVGGQVAKYVTTSGEVLRAVLMLPISHQLCTFGSSSESRASKN